jgi:hypothetical protein
MQPAGAGPPKPVPQPSRRLSRVASGSCNRLAGPAQAAAPDSGLSRRRIVETPGRGPPLRRPGEAERRRESVCWQRLGLPIGLPSLAGRCFRSRVGATVHDEG